MNVPFVKMSGAGNDMILVDHRAPFLNGSESAFARAACERREGIGADGLILVETDVSLDFSVRFFNPDGGEYDLCGNGARCLPLYVRELGLPGPEYRFRSRSGTHDAAMIDESTDRIRLPEVREIRLDVPVELDGRPVTMDWATSECLTPPIGPRTFRACRSTCGVHNCVTTRPSGPEART
jgi:diaminopimelate epimerase